MARVSYIRPKIAGVAFRGRRDTMRIPFKAVEDALLAANHKIERLNEEVDGLFEILGMRNLSAFVGEVFVRAMAAASKGMLVKNPHQDGYPDLLAMTQEGKALLKKLEGNMRDKSPFSNFATGGIEVKATCGSVPTPAVFAKKGLHKPDMGDARIEVMTGYDWKAHHRETNNLIGIVWDFIGGAPAIVGLFYCSTLEITDWGKIVKPKEGGGRTTSVSIMTREGIKKMYRGWLAVIDDGRYIEFFDRFNDDRLLRRAKGA